jgi:hypothetical protein
MATSGTVTYSVTELDIITDALQNAGVYAAAETVLSEDVDLCRRKLNLIYKQWNSQTDFAPGLKMWTRRRATMFLQKDQGIYSLGPSGDNTTESYVETALTATAVNGAATLTVASVTGMTTGDYVGVKLDSGSIFWTTINGAPSFPTITLTTVTSGGDAASGQPVFTYTTKMRRPFEILSAQIKNSDDVYAFIDPKVLLEEYESISVRNSQGTPTALYFEAQRTNAKVYLDIQPDDTSSVMSLVYNSYIEDTTVTTDTVDFPAEWFKPLAWQLTLDIAPSYMKPVTPEMKGARDEALRIAQRAYPEVTHAFFMTEPDAY